MPNPTLEVHFLLLLNGHRAILHEVARTSCAQAVDREDSHDSNLRSTRMRFSTLMLGLGCIVITVNCVGCRAQGAASAPPRVSSGAVPAMRPDADIARMPLVLATSEGERRIRRVMGGALAIIKVDRRNGGSPDLMMGYEELPPGQAIQPHRHPGMDEIIFVHRGTGTAALGDRTVSVSAGTTVFIPRATRVTLRNTGTEPLAIAFFFSQPGYEEYLRDTSTPEGQAAPPLSAPELAAIRERHKAHIVFDR